MSSAFFRGKHNLLSFKFVSFTVATATSSVLAYNIFNEKKLLNEKNPPHIGGNTFNSSEKLEPGFYSSKWNYDWDFKKKEYDDYIANQKEKTKRVTRRIYLVRHGQYIYGDHDHERKLTPLGIQQAKETGKALKRLPDELDIIYSSTMTRAVETTEHIIKELGYVDSNSVQFNDLFREGMPVEPIPRPKVPYCDDSDYFVEGARIEAAFRYLFYRPSPDMETHSTELLVAHGNVIRYMVCRALQLPPEGWLRMAINNCGVTRIDISKSGSVSIRFLGEIGHLDKELHTYG